MRRWKIVLPVLLLLPGLLAAQAVLVGRIVSDSSKAPVQGVEVVLEKPATQVQSDAEGRFRISNVPWGIQTATVRKIGYRPVRLRLMVASNDTLEVDLALKVAPVELEPIEVTASTFRHGMEEYARRKILGFGRFYDSDALDHAEGRRLGDFLAAVPGVRVVNRGSRAILTSSRSNCPMSVWLDNVQLSGGIRRVTQDINEFQISGLEGIEVYPSAGQTPAELLGTGSGSCGTVVLWTRRGR